ncbi:MAG: Flp pilus assembly protein TadD [Rhodothermales bacterium]|jgi:Flp pilus assembly protein TadD
MTSPRPPARATAARLLLLGLGLLIAGLASANSLPKRNGKATAKWLEGYGQLEDAIAAEKAGNLTDALEFYQSARLVFDEVQLNFPKWNPSMLQFRSAFCDSKIAALGNQVSAVQKPTLPPEETVRILLSKLKHAANTARAMQKELIRVNKALDLARGESARSSEELERGRQIGIRNQTLSTRNRELRSKVDELTAELKKAESRYHFDDLRLKLRQEQEHYKLKREELSKYKSQLDIQVGEYRAQNKRLSLEVQQLRSTAEKPCQDPAQAELLGEIQDSLDRERAANARLAEANRISEQRVGALQHNVTLLQDVINKNRERMAKVSQPTVVQTSLANAEELRVERQRAEKFSAQVQLLESKIRERDRSDSSVSQRIEFLEDQLTAMQNSRNEAISLRRERAAVDREMEKLQERIEFAESARNEFASVIAKRESRIAELERQLVEVAQDPRARKQAIEERTAELRTRVQKLIADHSKLSPSQHQAHSPQMQADLRSLTEELRKLGESQDSITSAALQVSPGDVTQIARVRADLTTAQQELSRYKAQLAHSAEQLKASEGRANSAAAQVEDLTVQLANRPAESAVNKQLAAAEDSLAAINSELERFEAKSKAADAREADSIARIQDLAERLAAEEALRLQAQALLAQANVAQPSTLIADSPRIHELQSLLESKNRELDTLQSANHQLRVTIDGLQLKFDTHVAELREEKHGIIGQRVGHDRLLAENAELKDKYEAQIALTRAISAKLKEPGRMTAPDPNADPVDLPGYQRLLQKQKTDLNATQSELSEHQVALINRDTELKRLRDEIGELRGSLSKTRDSKHFGETLLKKQIAKLLIENDAAEAELALLSEQVAASTVADSATQPEVTVTEIDTDAKVQELLHHGSVAEQQEKDEAAKWHYQRVLEVDPDNLAALQRLGHLLTDFGDFENAERYLMRAFYQDPDAQATLLPLGYALALQQKADLAVSMLSRAVALFPDNPHTHRSLGIACRQVGWLQPATVQFTRAFALDNADSDTAFNLAVLYATAEEPRLDMAKKWYQAARKLGAESDPGLERLFER